MKNSIALRKNRTPFSSPLRLFTDFESELDRFWGAAPNQSLVSFSPRSELKESEKEFIFHFDLPGMKKEDIQIEVKDGRLSISGERKSELEDEDGSHHWKEVQYGNFARIFELPHEVDESKIQASFSDGVLKLNVPKVEPKKGLQIQIS